jgi:glycine/D-amino acid oxidase-like deaminating enzyme
MPSAPDNQLRVQRLGSPDTTAQVNPRKLTEALLARAKELAGTELRIGVVDGVELGDDDESGGGGHQRVTGVSVDGELVPADAVVVAMGPWSGRAGKWLGAALAVSGQKYHSALLRTDAEVQPALAGDRDVRVLACTAHCWFALARSAASPRALASPLQRELTRQAATRPESRSARASRMPRVQITAAALFTHVKETAASKAHEPEIYPRLHNEVYVCGEPGHDALPDDPREVRPECEKCDRVIQNCSVVSSGFAEAEVVARQACYLPLTQSGAPVIGEVPGVRGAIVATGHSCWGILNAPATGLAVSELLLDGEAKCVDLSPFALKRAL